MLLISIAGEYAAGLADTGLEDGCNVMLFSDNVSIADEKALKEKAAANGLIVMGPDCGTANIAGAPLAFANIAPKGSIGIVGASGTGNSRDHLTNCITTPRGFSCNRSGGRISASKVVALVLSRLLICWRQILKPV